MKMGNCLRIVINKLRRKNCDKKNIVLLMAGLDKAGKSLVLNRLNSDPDQNVMPTMGFRMVTLKHKLYSVKVYDVGGAPQIRSIWKKYYNDIHGVIYVVDASDLNRLTENKLVFAELISHEHIAGKPILLLANKQDLPGAIDELDLVENLNVEHAANTMRCPTRVETCSCIFEQERSKNSAMGIISGYKWLLETISRNYTTLDHRIKVAQPSPIPLTNYGRIRSSVSSLRTPSRASIRSNPFKPIRELITKPSGNVLISNNHTTRKKGSATKTFLNKNKTAPMSNGQIIGQSQDNLNSTEIQIESFHNEHESDQIAIVTLDPLNLLHEQKINRPKQTRPFTAPALTYTNDIFSIVNIPGQVPQ